MCFLCEICNGKTPSTSNPTRCIHVKLNVYELFYSSEQCWGSTNGPVKSSASVLWPQMRVSVVSIPGGSGLTLLIFTAGYAVMLYL